MHPLLVTGDNASVLTQFRVAIKDANYGLFAKQVECATSVDGVEIDLQLHY